MNKIILPSLFEHANSPKGIVYAVVILLGSNDAVLPDLDKRTVPIPEYKDNLKDMILQVENYGIEKERIVLVAPPPTDVKAWGKYCEETGKPVSVSVSF